MCKIMSETYFLIEEIIWNKKLLQKLCDIIITILQKRKHVKFSLNDPKSKIFFKHKPFFALFSKCFRSDLKVSNYYCRVTSIKFILRQI